MNRDLENPSVGGHVAGNLSSSEQKALYETALRNQDVFNELASNEDLRQLFSHPQVRRELLEVLDAQERSRFSLLIDWLRRPVGLAFVGSVAAATFAVGLFWDQLFRAKPSVSLRPELARQAPASGTGVNSLLGNRLFDLPISSVAQNPSPSSLQLNRTEYRIGDPFRLQFTAPAGTNVLVMEKRPDGSFVQHFPNSLQSLPRIGESQEGAVPPSGQGSSSIAGPAGLRRVRLAIFPAELEPSSGFARAQALAVIEQEYRVEP